MFSLFDQKKTLEHYLYEVIDIHLPMHYLFEKFRSADVSPTRFFFVFSYILRISSVFFQSIACVTTAAVRKTDKKSNFVNYSSVDTRSRSQSIAFSPVQLCAHQTVPSLPFLIRNTYKSREDILDWPPESFTAKGPRIRSLLQCTYIYAYIGEQRGTRSVCM